MSEQPYSETALLSSTEEGETKESLKTARLTSLCSQMSIQILRMQQSETDKMKLHIAAWNVRTLLDAPGRHERRTAIIGRELGRYNIDIAALSETRISGESEFVEDGAGYTFSASANQKVNPDKPELALQSDRRCCSTFSSHPLASHLDS